MKYLSPKLVFNYKVVPVIMFFFDGFIIIISSSGPSLAIAELVLDKDII